LTSKGSKTDEVMAEGGGADSDYRFIEEKNNKGEFKEKRKISFFIMKQYSLGWAVRVLQQQSGELLSVQPSE